MVKVPEYQSDVSTRPLFQQGVDVRATPSAFGADVGRGMQGLAQGVSNVGDAISAIKELEDVNNAKEADNALADWDRNAKYGENGFMLLQGKAAVQGRAAYEAELEKKRKEFGAGLTPGAAQAYQKASQTRQRASLDQAIIHSGNEQKAWFKDASNARIETFANDALANFSNPTLVTKNATAGIMELHEQARMAGWDEDTLKLKQSEYVSAIHKSIVLRLAQDDPLKADSYVKANDGKLLPADKFSLDDALKGPVLAERAKSNAASIISGVPSQTYGSPVEAVKNPPAVAKPGAFQPLPDTPSKFGPVKFTEVASKFIGLSEGADGGTISAFIKNSAGINIDPRVTPWCAAFVNGVLGASGIEGTGKLNARSFLSFGMPTDTPRNGDIVVFSRGTGGQGHVGFFQGYDANGHIRVLGGNQGNKVSVASFSPDQVLGFRTAGNVSEQTAAMPNYGPQGLSDIAGKLAAIKDPEEREATRKALDAYFTTQKKAIDANREQAQTWIEGQLMANLVMDITKLPLDVQQTIGASGMTTLLNYQEKLRTSGEPVTDDRVLYDLQTQYANDPVAFGQVDLFQYRDKLSNADWNAVRGWRQTALTDKRKAKEEGLNLTSAFSQAEDQLKAVGVIKMPSKMTDEDNKRVAQFQNSLAGEMEAFKKTNENRAPTQMDIQSMVNKLLLPIVIDQPRAGGWLGTSTTDGFFFESGSIPEDATFRVEFKDIPIDLRQAIAARLEPILGRKPSDEEVATAYEKLQEEPTQPTRPEDLLINRILRPIAAIPAYAISTIGGGVETVESMDFTKSPEQIEEETDAGRDRETSLDSFLNPEGRQ